MLTAASEAAAAATAVREAVSSAVISVVKAAAASGARTVPEEFRFGAKFKLEHGAAGVAPGEASSAVAAASGGLR